jgi:hypothetical protein
VTELIQIKPEDVEYYSCSHYLTSKIFTTPIDQSLTCNIDSSLSCTLSPQSKLFDADLSGDICSNQTSWAYSSTRVNDISATLDYYATPDPSFCKITTKPDNSAVLSGKTFLLNIFTVSIKRKNNNLAFILN